MVLSVLFATFVTAGIVALTVAVLSYRNGQRETQLEQQLRRCQVSGIVHEPSEERRFAELLARSRARAQERIVSDQQEGQAA